MMSLNRRAFLAAIISGASVASALTAGHADAATVNEYRKLIDLQERVILMTEKIYGEAPFDTRVPKNVDYNDVIAISSASDDLIFYLTQEFDPTPDYENDDIRRAVFRIFREGIYFDTMSEDELRKHERSVVSIATVLAAASFCC